MTDGDMKAMAGALGARLFEKLEVSVFSFNKDLTDRGLTTFSIGCENRRAPSASDGGRRQGANVESSFRSHKRSPVI